MSCGTVTLIALVVLTCLQASPVPKKIVLIKDSTFGVGLAALDSKTNGVFQDNKDVDINIPKEIEGEFPEFTLLENVNAGAALAVGGSLSIGVIKDSIINGKNPFWSK